MDADNNQDGLASVSAVEALADQLGDCADALHARLMKAIKAQHGDFSDAEQAALRGLLDDEQLLRQQADSLYADAATAVLPALGLPQQQLLALTAAAAEKIRQIGMLGELIGLSAALLALAGSALHGNAGGVVSALGQLRTHAAGVAAHRAPAAKP